MLETGLVDEDKIVAKTGGISFVTEFTFQGKRQTLMK